jgi:putative nucleotidyltransferase with HDIG domain
MQAISDYVRNLRYLPPAPRVVPELMRLINQPDADSSRIVNLISYDPSLTTNVLRISNSAYFGAATPISNLQDAVTRLGFQQIYQLVAAATGAKILGASQEGYGMEQGDLWKHSVTAAAAAQLIARQRNENENVVFTATLLHDIGKTILSDSLKGAYSKIVAETEGNGHSLLEAETKLFGINHAELGGQLLQHWNFSPDIIAAVSFHHTPKNARAYQRLASCVYMGNMVACFMGHGYGHVAFAQRARTEVLADLEMTEQSVPQLMMETFEQMQLIEAFFSSAA